MIRLLPLPASPPLSISPSLCYVLKLGAKLLKQDVKYIAQGRERGRGKRDGGAAKGTGCVHADYVCAVALFLDVCTMSGSHCLLGKE